ncbi:MAG: hypothetical protein GY866_10950 [Proteobacteria bacterium]|nr:hypothetical protein [Pseudomonadota bacterium]
MASTAQAAYIFSPLPKVTRCGVLSAVMPKSSAMDAAQAFFPLVPGNFGYLLPSPD